MVAEQEIYEDLRLRLTRGEFDPGQRLRSSLLRQDYGVSSSTIREILFRLSTRGLVDFFPQRGFRHPELSEVLKHDLAQTRIMLESEGACLSLRYGGVAWEARLTAAHHELLYIEKYVSTCIEKSVPGEKLFTLWAAAELNFHRTLVGNCRSPLLMDFHLQVYDRFRQQLALVDKEFSYNPLNLELHQKILDSVLQHDEDAVRKYIYEHLWWHMSEPLPKKTKPVGRYSLAESKQDRMTPAPPLQRDT